MSSSTAKTEPLPLVSIIMPSYNQGAYIGDAIRSVLAQTYPHWELLVQDDGSTDHTREVVSGFSDPRIRYEWTPNSGLPAVARNRAIRRASGELISFLDSDDLWLPQKLSLQVALHTRDPELGASYARNEIFNETGPVRLAPPLRDASEGQIFTALCFKNFIGILTVMIRKDSLHKLGSESIFDETPSLRAVEDYDLWLRLSRLCRFRFIPEVVARYRIHGNNISGNPLDSVTRAEQVVTRLIATGEGADVRRAYALRRLKWSVLSSPLESRRAAEALADLLGLDGKLRESWLNNQLCQSLLGVGFRLLGALLGFREGYLRWKLRI